MMINTPATHRRSVLRRGIAGGLADVAVKKDVLVLSDGNLES